MTQHDVIPILLRHCTVCHGTRRKEGDLDLRTKASMVRGGKSGPAVDLAHPDDSLLLKKIRAGEMPPHQRLVEASVKPVEPAEADVIARWIAAGTPEDAIAPDVATTTPDPLVTDKDREFWAFRPPQAVTVPVVHHQERVRNPIDAFVLRKLEERGPHVLARGGPADAIAAGLLRPDRAAARTARDPRSSSTIQPRTPTRR